MTVVVVVFARIVVALPFHRAPTSETSRKKSGERKKIGSPESWAQHVERQKLITAECHQQIGKQICQFPLRGMHTDDNHIGSSPRGAYKGSDPAHKHGQNGTFN